MNNLVKNIVVLQGDITKIAADAIVNSAHETLVPGGGVSGAIHAQAGPSVAQACHALYEQQGKQSAGAALVTEAGKLDAQYIIHAVGPRWQGGQANEAELLAQTYRNIIYTAERLAIQTITLPALSVGIFAFPLEQATKIAIDTLVDALDKTRHVKSVILVCFSAEITCVYESVLYQAQSKTQPNDKISFVSLAPTYQ